MGNIFAGQKPLVSLFCINLKDANHITIHDRVDGKAIKGEKKKKVTFFLVLEKKKKMENQQKKFKYSKKEIEHLVSLLENKKKSNPPQNDNPISVEKIDECEKKKFKVIEHTFSISVKRKANVNFIAFIQSLTLVFTYLINYARTTVKKNDDYVRFIFSHAPKSYFSTAVMKLSDLNVKYFLNTFERQMQSNQEIIANGWECTVVIQTFPSGQISNNKKKNPLVRKKKIYNRLNQANENEGGGGKVNKTITKYDRKFRTGVFYIISTKLTQCIKKCCFALGILVGLSFLHKDSRYESMTKHPSKSIDDLFCVDEIRNVYQQSGIPEGEVKINQFSMMYENFLKVQGSVFRS